MGIKNIYSEIEADKENAVDGCTCTCTCPKCSGQLESQQDFIEEHRELIKCLREGSREELLACAEEQEEELENFLEMNGLPDTLMCEDESTENE